MSILQAIILGIVQGLTEFIPISSTAHLIFASRAINLYENDAMRAQLTTATIAVIQLGTLLAVLIYFASDIWNITTAFIRDHLALLSGKRSRFNRIYSFDCQGLWISIAPGSRCSQLSIRTYEKYSKLAKRPRSLRGGAGNGHDPHRPNRHSGEG